ncbi:RNA polymerase primary sigma factor/RNA polymerase nonessential primary-like sigma factor [Amycolatopsis bartoniae]|uniref:RNA polymerase principal sigma factor HrdC n=1 Tax=Amycolatopsis bartoniae TaxID=941986 RepID=A0A8H9IU30_9PSEU|nr:sigma-70 family RNA polymerase sigma factor [Amycolatopsis bartoniae]MBB2937155.1 RNA polymerase primary sigma factor/RNA polymerase nonessential primary-like sigma factor [Amycolatopsis bartoniae]GHF52844.1 RNA polymerase principal sigma factor HrdC [Amycolatopsis bartoniae]
MAKRTERRTEEPDSVRVYLDAIGAVPLLTATEEVELAKRIEAGVYAEELLRRADAGEQELTVERRDLERVVRDGARAKDHMIEANLRLVVAAARKRRERSMPLLDLVQEGNLGLIRAVEKFDYTKGYKFSTYAMWWIRQAMQRGIAFGSRAIRVPEHASDQLAKLERVEAALRADADHDPTPEELAEATALPLNRVTELKAVARVTTSLDAPIGDGDVELGDLIGSTDDDPVGDTIAREATTVLLGEALDSLPPLAKKVISLRYGLDDGRQRTLQQAAEQVGVTRSQARRLEQEALTELRDPARREALLPVAG